MDDLFENLKILIVDDQDEARAILRSLLTGFGVVHIFEATDGDEAFRFMKSGFNFISLVICDWNMPGLNGVELLREIRSLDPTMPFLMVTGRGDMDSVIEAKTSGVGGYIRKPFSPAQLEAKLRVIMQKALAA